MTATQRRRARRGNLRAVLRERDTDTQSLAGELSLGHTAKGFIACPDKGESKETLARKVSRQKTYNDREGIDTLARRGLVYPFPL